MVTFIYFKFNLWSPGVGSFLIGKTTEIVMFGYDDRIFFT